MAVKPNIVRSHTEGSAIAVPLQIRLITPVTYTLASKTRISALAAASPASLSAIVDSVTIYLSGCLETLIWKKD